MITACPSAGELEPSPQSIAPEYSLAVALGSGSVKVATVPLKLAPSVALMVVPVAVIGNSGHGISYAVRWLGLPVTAAESPQSAHFGANVTRSKVRSSVSWFAPVEKVTPVSAPDVVVWKINMFVGLFFVGCQRFIPSNATPLVPPSPPGMAP